MPQENSLYGFSVTITTDFAGIVASSLWSTIRASSNVVGCTRCGVAAEL
jgi:hypothetical protein